MAYNMESDTTAQRNFPARIWFSIFPGMRPAGGEGVPRRNWFNALIFHFRPRRVPAQTLRLSLSWGLGGMAVVLVGLLFSTGLMLKFVYRPVPDGAYGSILLLENRVLFGRLIRNIHHWSANLILLVVFLHLLRVFFTGAFHAPRQFNWVIGLNLLLILLASNFTGYLLPYDQLSYWAVTICSSMLEYLPGAGPALQAWLIGGPEVGAGTLTTFYAFHTALLPALLLLILPFHFWRVRKAGGLVTALDPEEEPAPEPLKAKLIPDLLVRELTVSAVLVALVLILSVTVAAPLGNEANPGLSPNPTKAPWYFAGLQELLVHVPPAAAVAVLPAAALIFLLILPYLRYPERAPGIWFISPKGRKMAGIAAILSTSLTVLWILVDRYGIGSSSAPAAPALKRWLPAAGVLLLPVLLAGSLQRVFRATRSEAVQALVVFLVVMLAVLTVTGIWFRGVGMQLVWPWHG